MLILSGLRLPLSASEADALAEARQALGLPASAQLHLHKVSVDARKRPPRLVYSVAVELVSAAEEERIAHANPGVRLARPVPLPAPVGNETLSGRAVVCGLGPAGLFAALALAEAGFRPLVLERGGPIEERRVAVEAFAQTGRLDEHNNIQFGEGGAGTFSDGKLVTRIKDPLCATVVRHLLDAGAPPDIAWRAKPHIGTDLLQGVFIRLRRRLQQLGGEVLFNTKLTGFTLQGGRLAGVDTTSGHFACGALVLAPGHSARDTFAALAEAGASLAAKPFSVGVRAEHLQQTINEGLYHEAAGHPALPAGEYQLSHKVAGRGVYTFCMCPGGSVVAAASEAGGVVTNGMSLHDRGGANANAAVVVGVQPEDFGGDPFAAIEYQRGLEQAAFAAGGAGYTAPAQTMDAFLAGTGGLHIKRVQPTYPLGVVEADLAALLGEELSAAMRGGLAAFGRKLPGYTAPDTVLTGLETRTSSPVRILRHDERLEAIATPGLWPCGEGAGYAGGIMSAAVDGLRVARAIRALYKPG